MDEGTSRLSQEEQILLRRLEEDLAREDPWFAASLAGPTARQYRWPRICRLRSRSYLAIGLGLTLLAVLVHQTFTFLLALTFFAAAVARTLHDA